MDPTTEKNILRLYRMGQKHQAFSEILRYLGDDVYGLAYHFTKNEEDASDITQDVFLKIWKKFHTFKGESSLKSWILQITRNACLSHLTSRHYRISREDGDYGQSANESQQHETFPDLRTCVESLPADTKTPLVLYHFMSCRYEEIAHILDLPLNTVKARIRRGRLMLVKQLKAKGYHHAM
ncbi:RNA polymerase sigma factor [Fidelibacter multiformis]|uniref:RNA polymerase sigma factor n=1 Tax=Fidelibacter multiformis TaxID=3377529 RepID=UPI0037DDBDD7